MHTVEISRELPEQLRLVLRTLLDGRVYFSQQEESPKRYQPALPGSLRIERTTSPSVVRLVAVPNTATLSVGDPHQSFDLGRASGRLRLLGHVVWTGKPGMAVPPLVQNVLHDKLVTLSLVHIILRLGVEVSIAELCNRVCIHEITLRRLLRNESAAVPRTVQSLARMLFIAQRMESECGSLERLSNDLQFSATPNFCRFVKRVVGCSPEKARSLGAMNLAIGEFVRAFSGMNIHDSTRLYVNLHVLESPLPIWCETFPLA